MSKTLEKLFYENFRISINIDVDRDMVEIENLREYVEKESSILYTNPNLSIEWNYERNGSLKPEHYKANSNKKVWWKCENGHEWQATISSRNRGVGCPYCKGQKVIAGYNDLKTLNPKLANEWNYEKNNGLTPSDVLPKSGKKVWWKCEYGHEWQATIANRSNGTGCPICKKSHKL